MSSRLASTSGLRPEAHAPPASTPCGTTADTAPLADAQLVQLRIRVIAVENLVISLRAEASDRPLAQARVMATGISARTGFAPHPVTLRAADEMLSLIDRADRYLRPLRP